jgi:hypothetical protein
MSLSWPLTAAGAFPRLCSSWFGVNRMPLEDGEDSKAGHAVPETLAVLHRGGGDRALRRIPAVVSSTSREYLSCGTAEHTKFWQPNGLVSRSPTGGFSGARSGLLLALVALGFRHYGVLLNHLKRRPVKSACQSSRVKP